MNFTDGGSIYNSKDGKNWQPASEVWSDPFFAGTHHISAQVVFKDEFYVGTFGLQGVLLKMVHPDK